MDIQRVSIEMATSKVTEQASTAMLKKSLDNYKQTGEQLTKMMELSVNPNLGKNIDVRL